MHAGPRAGYLVCWSSYVVHLGFSVLPWCMVVGCAAAQRIVCIMLRYRVIGLDMASASPTMVILFITWVFESTVSASRLSCCTPYVLIVQPTSVVLQPISIVTAHQCISFIHGRRLRLLPSYLLILTASRESALASRMPTSTLHTSTTTHRTGNGLRHPSYFLILHTPARQRRSFPCRPTRGLPAPQPAG